MSTVLIINSGSSSFKYQVLEMATEAVIAKGLVERIGEALGTFKHENLLNDESIELEVPIADHTAGFALMYSTFREHGPEHSELLAVGHRVVHGGRRFFAPTIVDDAVEWNIHDLAALAPLHNPGAVQGIRAARAAYPTVPHVAVFDTAFHQSLPPEAYRYAIDRELADKYRIRKYGFHGTSHEYVAREAARFLGHDPEEFNAITLHLGNGASACAVRGGRSVDTSMGMTPLEGLVMGTRSGDLDPAVLFHLSRHAGLGISDFDTLLNKRSGLLGLAGVGDMRDVLRLAAEGVIEAQEAFDIYVHRLKHYIGGYYAQLGRVDAIIFTAGVGENSPVVRERALAGLERMGIVVDAERNEAAQRGIRRISPDDGEVAVLVVPTNEELEIARQAAAVALAAAE